MGSNWKEVLIKEQVRILDSAKYYDVYNADTNEIIAKCSEKISLLKRILRNSFLENATSFFIKLSFKDNETIYLKRKGTFLLSKIEILDKKNRLLAKFKENFASLGQSIKIYDEQENVLLDITGDILAWKFNFIHKGQIIASVERQFSGVLKEAFTKADNYKIIFHNTEILNDSLIPKLIIAIAICLDVVITDGFQYFRNAPLTLSRINN